MQAFDQACAPSGAASPSGPLDALGQMIRARKIPNALLFHGPAGTGKKKAALEFAKSCNCTAGGSAACNTCISCKKINTDMHPDLVFSGPEEKKKNITIDQIRDLGRRICTRPNEADYRMICIEDAGRMNVQAQNALLKMLEEPPDKTFFVLVTQDISPLLPTILSRCRSFRFKPASSQRLQQTLCSGTAMDPALARVIALTRGPDLAMALDWVDNGGSWPDTYAVFRQWLIPALAGVTKGERQTRIGSSLSLSRKLAADPVHLASARPVIRSALRDLCVLRYAPDQIVNLDFFDVFNDISQIHAYPTFLGWLTAFCKTEKRLDTNIGPRLALDQFFLELSLS